MNQKKVSKEKKGKKSQELCGFSRFKEKIEGMTVWEKLSEIGGRMFLTGKLLNLNKLFRTKSGVFKTPINKGDGFIFCEKFEFGEILWAYRRIKTLSDSKTKKLIIT